MSDVASLALLGLTSYEAQAYLALLGRPRLSPAEVAALAKIPRQRVYDVLESLAGKGLCLVREESPKSYAALEPGQARIGHRALLLAGAARERVNSCVRRPLILSPEQNTAFMDVPLARGLCYRALYEESALDDPLLRGWIDDLSGRGLVVRLIRELPLKMQAFDDEVVLVSMQDPMAGEPGFTAVVIRNRGMVAMMNLAFEHLWESARAYAG
jgi:hypothetical protein